MPDGRWNKRAVLYLDSISPFTLEPSVDWHFCPLLTSTSVYRIIVHQPQSAGSVGITQYSGLVWNSGGMACRSATVSSGFTCENPGAAGAAGKGSLPWPRGRVQTYAHSQSQSALQQLCVALTRVHWHMSSGTVLSEKKRPFTHSLNRFPPASKGVHYTGIQPSEPPHWSVTTDCVPFFTQKQNKRHIIFEGRAPVLLLRRPGKKTEYKKQRGCCPWLVGTLKVSRLPKYGSASEVAFH